MTTNPMVAERNARGLARNEWALLLNVGLSALAAVELGHVLNVPRTWRGKLAGHGIDYDVLEADYQAWRVERAEVVSARVKAKQEA